jgi:multidrug resistance efflux pump
MLSSKTKFAAPALVCIAILSGAIGIVCLPITASRALGPSFKHTQVAAATKRTIQLASPIDGIVAAVATFAKEKDGVANNRFTMVQVGREQYNLRRLKRGDPIEQGQLLACLDCRLAAADVAFKEGLLKIVEIKLESAKAEREEMQARYHTKMRLTKQDAAAVEEVRSGLFKWHKAELEEAAKKACVELAKLEVQRAKTRMEMHFIRSPSQGAISAILKRPGESVHALEPILEIQIEDQD